MATSIRFLPPADQPPRTSSGTSPAPPAPARSQSYGTQASGARPVSPMVQPGQRGPPYGNDIDHQMRVYMAENARTNAALPPLPPQARGRNMQAIPAPPLRGRPPMPPAVATSATYYTPNGQIVTRTELWRGQGAGGMTPPNVFSPVDSPAFRNNNTRPPTSASTNRAPTWELDGNTAPVRGRERRNSLDGAPLHPHQDPRARSNTYEVGLERSNSFGERQAAALNRASSMSPPPTPPAKDEKYSPWDLVPRAAPPQRKPIPVPARLDSVILPPAPILSNPRSDSQQRQSPNLRITVEEPPEDTDMRNGKPKKEKSSPSATDAFVSKITKRIRGNSNPERAPKKSPPPVSSVSQMSAAPWETDINSYGYEFDNDDDTRAELPGSIPAEDEKPVAELIGSVPETSKPGKGRGNTRKKKGKRPSAPARGETVYQTRALPAVPPVLPAPRTESPLRIDILNSTKRMTEEEMRLTAGAFSPEGTYDKGIAEWAENNFFTAKNEPESPEETEARSNNFARRNSELNPEGAVRGVYTQQAAARTSTRRFPQSRQLSMATSGWNGQSFGSSVGDAFEYDLKTPILGTIGKGLPSPGTTSPGMEMVEEDEEGDAEPVPNEVKKDEEKKEEDDKKETEKEDEVTPKLQPLSTPEDMIKALDQIMDDIGPPSEPATPVSEARPKSSPAKKFDGMRSQLELDDSDDDDDESFYDDEEYGSRDSTASSAQLQMEIEAILAERRRTVKAKRASQASTIRGPRDSIASTTYSEFDDNSSRQSVSTTYSDFETSPVTPRQSTISGFVDAPTTPRDVPGPAFTFDEDSTDSARNSVASVISDYGMEEEISTVRDSVSTTYTDFERLLNRKATRDNVQSTYTDDSDGDTRTARQSMSTTYSDFDTRTQKSRLSMTTTYSSNPSRESISTTYSDFTDTTPDTPTAAAPRLSASVYDFPDEPIPLLSSATFQPTFEPISVPESPNSAPCSPLPQTTFAPFFPPETLSSAVYNPLARASSYDSSRASTASSASYDPSRASIASTASSATINITYDVDSHFSDLEQPPFTGLEHDTTSTRRQSRPITMMSNLSNYGPGFDDFLEPTPRSSLPAQPSHQARRTQYLAGRNSELGGDIMFVFPSSEMGTSMGGAPYGAASVDAPRWDEEKQAWQKPPWVPREQRVSVDNTVQRRGAGVAIGAKSAGGSPYGSEYRGRSRSPGGF